MIIPAPLATEGLAQFAVEKSTQLTRSLLFSAEVRKVGVCTPVLMPFTCQVYSGLLPPFAIVAEKVTELPGQIVFVPATILSDTEAATVGFTVRVIAELVAVLVSTQGAFEVIVQSTTSLLEKEVDEKAGLLVPAFTPLTCH
jgi:hypothetical protein